MNNDRSLVRGCRAYEKYFTGTLRFVKKKGKMKNKLVNVAKIILKNFKEFFNRACLRR